MLRRELILRMANGERLVGKSLDSPFVLGETRSDRDQLPSWVVQRLISDGLAKAVPASGEVQIVLTEETARWYEKRKIPQRQAMSVTA
jgi:hypothetical protein